MIITEITPTGYKEKTLTAAQVKYFAKLGDREAIREIIENKGGYDALTAAQKDRVIKLLLGYEVEL